MCELSRNPMDRISPSTPANSGKINPSQISDRTAPDSFRSRHIRAAPPSSRERGESLSTIRKPAPVWEFGTAFRHFQHKVSGLRGRSLCVGYFPGVHSACSGVHPWRSLARIRFGSTPVISAHLRTVLISPRHSSSIALRGRSIGQPAIYRSLTVLAGIPKSFASRGLCLSVRYE